MDALLILGHTFLGQLGAANSFFANCNNRCNFSKVLF